MTERIRAWLDDSGVTGVQVIGVNHDGVALGKYLSPERFLKAIDQGSPLADVAFGFDFSGELSLGWDWADTRGNVIDIAIRPDASTLTIDPATPDWGLALCDFTHADGRPLSICPRTQLRLATERLAALGYSALTAFELEFMVFAESLEEARDKNFRGLTPLGGPVPIAYLMTRSNKLTAFMNEVLRKMDALGVPWESWTNEAAPGQVEINVPPTDPITAADYVTKIKLALRRTADEEGRSVTFMAAVEDGGLGSGMHINHSLVRDGANAFFDPHSDGNATRLLGHWVAGLLTSLPAAMSIFVPTVNSYRRMIELTGPPLTLTWGEDNKSVAVRTIVRDEKTARAEHRVASSDCNPYLAAAAILIGGMLGIEHELAPPEPFEGMAWHLPPEAAPRLPNTLSKALAAFEENNDFKEAFGKTAATFWIGTRRWEWMHFDKAGGDPKTISDFELRRYFEQV